MNNKTAKQIMDLPDDMTVWGDALSYRIGTVGELKALVRKLDKAVETLEHYADEEVWEVAETTMPGTESEEPWQHFYSVNLICSEPGFAVAQAALAEIAALASAEESQNERSK